MIVAMKLGVLITAALLAGGLAVVHRRRRLSRPVLVLAALVFCALLVTGAGVIHPPSPEVMIRDGARALGPFAYVLVGALAYLETAGGMGLILPGELAVILGGVGAGQGELSLPGLIALVWACALAGDLTSYALGRRLGREFLTRHGGAIGVSDQRLAQVERFYADHGGKTIAVGRFIGLVRVLSPFIAGASRMSARRFAAYTTAASGIWAFTFSLLGYAFWQSLDDLIALTKEGSLTLAAVVAMIVGAVALYRRRRPRSEAAR
jgi:membrane protein DedA with SNARE-associated domain